MEPADVNALVARAKKGDRRAFDDLVTAYYDKVYRLANNIVKNEEDAKEVTQQTWVKIWKKLDTFKEQSAFYTWAYRITTFTAWDWIRKRKRRAEVNYIDEMETGLEPESFPVQGKVERPDREYANKEIMEKFNEALKQLSEKHRTALVLREIDGLSYAEIAEVMKCSKGTVMSRIFNARKAIQNYLGDFR